MSDVDSTRIALVTGANRGIGKAIAQRLADDGLRVVGTATSDDGAAQIDAALEPQNGRGYAVRIDDDSSVDAFVARLKEDVGLPLVLVNNAGITRDNLLLRMSIEEWSAVIETNVTGLYRLCKPMLRAMTRARWGRIINLSSVVARMGNPGQTNYATSKAAVEGFTKALAAEVGSRGVTVNAVAPGFIETDMTNALSDERRAALLARIPLGKLGTVDDVASLVSFIASDAAGYITGETLHVNGGLHMA